jgi:hypothetical protein
MTDQVLQRDCIADMLAPAIHDLLPRTAEMNHCGGVKQHSTQAGRGDASGGIEEPVQRPGLSSPTHEVLAPRQQIAGRQTLFPSRQVL